MGNQGEVSAEMTYSAAAFERIWRARSCGTIFLVCLLFLFLPMVLSLPSLSFAADLAQCGGVWTNLPCIDGRPTGERVRANKGEVSDADARTLVDPVEVENRRKRDLVSALDLKARRAKREYGVEVLYQDVRAQCLEQGYSLERCGSSVRDIEERIDRKVAEASAKVDSKGNGSTDRADVPARNEVTVIHNSFLRDCYRTSSYHTCWARRQPWQDNGGHKRRDNRGKQPSVPDGDGSSGAGTGGADKKVKSPWLRPHGTSLTSSERSKP